MDHHQKQHQDASKKKKPRPDKGTDDMGKLSDASRTITKSLRVLTVEPIMFVLSMTIYMRTPSSQQLVLHKICRQNYNDTICSDVDNESSAVENDIHAAAAYWNFYLKMALFIPGAVVSSLYGPLSDRLGRRWFLIIPSVGNIFGAVSFIFQSYFPNLPLDYLIASEVVVGVSGNVVTAYIVAKSYLCDVTDSMNRTKRLGVMKAMSHVGGPIGAFMAGVLIDQGGFAAVYFVLVGIHVLVILYVLLWLEETVDYASDQEDDNVDDDDEEEPDGEVDDDDGKEEGEGEEEEQGDEQNARKEEVEMKEKKEVTENKEADKSREGTCGGACDFLRLPLIEVGKSLRQMFLICFLERRGSRRKYLLLVMLIGMIHNVCSTAESDLIVLYTKHSPLSWSATTIGVFISLRTALKAATLALGLPAIFKLAKNHTVQLDLSLASVGIVSTSAALTMIAFAQTTTVMMIAAFVGMFVSFPSVALTAVKSKLVVPHEYGALFAVTALVQTLVSVAASGLFNNLYVTLLPIWPGLPFIVTVGFYAVSLLVIWYICHDMKATSSDEESINDDGSGYKKLRSVEDGKTG